MVPDTPQPTSPMKATHSLQSLFLQESPTINPKQQTTDLNKHLKASSIYDFEPRNLILNQEYSINVITHIIWHASLV